MHSHSAVHNHLHGINLIFMAAIDVFFKHSSYFGVPNKSPVYSGVGHSHSLCKMELCDPRGRGHMAFNWPHSICPLSLNTAL